MMNKAGTLFLLVSAILQANAMAVSGDEPDYSKESRFHQIYKSYNEQPTSAEHWGTAVGKHSVEVYEIQQGDTLSEISTTLFGDQFFWPKLWSLNSQHILNPHEISPGMKVKFVAGDVSDAPHIELGDQKQEVQEKIVAAKNDDSNVNEKSPSMESGGKVEIPPPTKKRAALLKKLPSSLPKMKYKYQLSNSLDFKNFIAEFKMPAANTYLSYYISESPIVGVGTVVGTELNSKVANEFQYIFVKLNSKGEKNYVAKKNLSEVKEASVSDATMIQVQGQIEVLESVNSEENIYRAVVKKCIDPVEVGAILEAGKLPMMDITPTSESSGTSARIVGGAYDDNRRIIAPHSIVFLAGGSNQGFKVGQSFRIFADESKRNLPVEVTMNERSIGTLKIVHTGPQLSTAYVVNASQDILVGDYVGERLINSNKQSAKSQVEEESVLESPKVEKASKDAYEEKDFEDSPETDGSTSESGSSEEELEL